MVCNNKLKVKITSSELSEDSTLPRLIWHISKVMLPIEMQQALVVAGTFSISGFDGSKIAKDIPFDSYLTAIRQLLDYKKMADNGTKFTLIMICSLGACSFNLKIDG